jgi:alpha-glucosidase
MKINFRISLFTLLFIIFFFSKGICGARPVVISSPDKNLQLYIGEAANGKLYYYLEFNKAVVIESSTLGLTINGNVIDEGKLINISRYSINETYSYRGVHSLVTNKCNGAKISFAGKINLIIEARVFNDGIAFRYLIKGKDSSSIEKDNTGFIIPAGSTTWSQSNIKYYEGKYVKKMILDFKAGDLVGPPITIQFPANEGYAAITEAGLVDFGGMSLKYTGSRSFESNLTGITKKYGNFETSWRVIEIGKDLNTLVNCDIIANVSPPFDPKLFPKGYNTDWVKPGRSVWSWLAEKKRSITLENMKYFSDQAAALGFEYNLVDEGWSNWKDTINNRSAWDMMKELVDYSAKKGVKIWVWKAYPDRGGIAGINTTEKRKIFFQKCKDLGIAGMKVDFFDSESQEIIKFYQASLRDAAAYNLMMDFHGANKPTGEERTWPNEMTREGVRGLENQAPWAPTNTIIPFTRYLAGSGDFTPVHFGNRLGEVSWAHHIASMIVFTSSFLCLGADPQSVLDNPCRQMIQSIPSTWDETIALPDSKIGELVLFARRKGSTWFLAAMNGSKEPVTLQLPLSFLKKGTYKLAVVKDDKQKQANAILEDQKVIPSSILTIEINGSGGYVARLEK